MRLEEFDYDLPERLIAQVPLDVRDQSRLLVVDPVEQSLHHRVFADIVDYLEPQDVLVLNDSRVLPARLFATKVDTGARAEILLLRPSGDDPQVWQALTRPAKRLRRGTRLRIGEERDGVEIEIVDTHEEGVRSVRFLTEEPVEQVADRLGQMPLPPYIHEDLQEKERYQTVYAKTTGSVAAPTAGLHFTTALLDRIRDKGVQICHVTLHVGLGTFRTVQVEHVESHRMHSEWYEVDERTAEIVNEARERGSRVVAVGTTALRTLESAGASGRLLAQRGETDIFIYPGYQFRIADALITNFHLPKSTLFMLVCAWLGTDFAKEVYRQAVEAEYRFFSFGDAMFIARRAHLDAPGDV
ncbi:tRNA preQ1(34) S-adenosylmethionine ribosyltransferase-isomerase QueA [Alicyclobacillus acidiphilus]|uniref:tRNA preQ1(34) S-adenosylmethionine ribosyltransferase-isomerase QueA n=1 Tax=Alicyclobacillus acidiphilus TaxID=182455 RepID=UPI00082EF5B5|nr:tRNA preQ1(34) S-adenosylmethionine ribosyltransferase-isomerase QueA [Alicyclobacillus acidiphilus]